MSTRALLLGYGAGDPFWASVVLLIGNDNAANGSTTFTDQSSAHNSASHTGAPAYSNGQAPTGMSTSILYTGTGAGTSGQDSIYWPTGNFAFGTGDFTAECMLRTTSWSATRQLFEFRANVSDNVRPLLGDSNGSNLLSFWNNVQKISGTLPSTSAWHHLAYSRNSGTTRAWLDGSASGSSAADSNNYTNNGTFGMIFGASVLNTNGFGGNVCCLRVTNGIGRYPAAFTPPTLPLPTHA